MLEKSIVLRPHFFLEVAATKPSFSLLVSKGGGVFRAFGLPGGVMVP